MKVTGIRQKAAKLALLAVLAQPVMPAFAQDDLLLSETDQILNSDQIDIEGLYQKKQKRPSAADRVAKMRKELERKTNEMVDKKIEDERTKAEIKLTKQLQDAFQRGFNSMNSDSVNYGQSAVQRIENKVKPVEGEKKHKVYLSTGMTNFTGQSLDIESNLKLEGGFESEITDRFTVGIGLGYMKVDAIDIGRSSYYNSNVSYNRYKIEMNGKFQFIKDSKFRPYAGAGVAYNKSKAQYENSNYMPTTSNCSYYGYCTYNNSNYYQYDEGFSSSYLSGAVMLGSDVNFTSSFGINLEVRYDKALSSGYDKNLPQQGLSSDQGDLRNITGQIEDADQISVNAGLLYRF
ncbi:outer membrane beta-barrel protein [Halobacteriovorax sp. GB3]|uniref:outer membrane beta-barrel protein n=1 Tax=Halobacteriovorax sp. GB3 TaxID=2719615 RepID=UPI002362BFFC|nr:outer membrane beta-barrel protein [Halobacteriovorax sp. GB3]MDD0852732.1 outer membrane beta-barrel protein [Halobacteriovorax sp. GB3]